MQNTADTYDFRLLPKISELVHPDTFPLAVDEIMMY